MEGLNIKIFCLKQWFLVGQARAQRGRVWGILTAGSSISTGGKGQTLHAGVGASTSQGSLLVGLSIWYQLLSSATQQPARPLFLCCHGDPPPSCSQGAASSGTSAGTLGEPRSKSTLVHEYPCSSGSSPRITQMKASCQVPFCYRMWLRKQMEGLERQDGL